jgi:hypothetical protein
MGLNLGDHREAATLVETIFQFAKIPLHGMLFIAIRGALSLIAFGLAPR